MTGRARHAAAAAMLVAITGCDLAPDVGPLLAGVCSDTDTDPGASVSFANQIRPLLNSPTGCSCHMPGPFGVAIPLSGLDLGSLSSLRSGGRLSGAEIVVAREPCSSILYQKVSEAPPFGSRMPLDGPPYLNADELALLHDWIAEGAADN